MLEDKVIERTMLLMRAKRTWEATFDALVDPITIVDEQLQIVRTNVALAETSGVDIRTVSGRHCYEAFLGRTSPCEGCPAQRSFITGEHGESEVSTQDGERVFRVWSHPMSTTHTEEAGMRQVVCHYKELPRRSSPTLQSEKMAAVGTSPVALPTKSTIRSAQSWRFHSCSCRTRKKARHFTIREKSKRARNAKNSREPLLLSAEPSERRSVNWQPS